MEGSHWQKISEIFADCFARSERCENCHTDNSESAENCQKIYCCFYRLFNRVIMQIIAENIVTAVLDGNRNLKQVNKSVDLVADYWYKARKIGNDAKDKPYKNKILHG